MWRPTVDLVDDKAHKVALRLEASHSTQCLHGMPSTLELRAEACDERASISLIVENRGTEELSWTGGLHPYFAVPNISGVTVRGLEGATVADRYAPDRTIETAAALVFDGQPFERLYSGPAGVVLEGAEGALLISMSGFEEWMVWNPGAEGAAALSDMEQDDWKRFICIEPVVVSRPKLLQPGDSFLGSLEITCV